MNPPATRDPAPVADSRWNLPAWNSICPYISHDGSSASRPFSRESPSSASFREPARDAWPSTLQRARKWSTWNCVAPQRSATSTVPSSRTNAATRRVSAPSRGTTTGRANVTCSNVGEELRPVSALTASAIASSPITAGSSSSPWKAWSAR